MLGLSMTMTVACFAIVFAGALVQSTIGIGMGMLAAPVLALADSESFIPGVIVILVLPLSVTVAWRYRTSIDRRGFWLALLGRAPGVVAGTWIAAVVSSRVLAVLVGVSVLAAVVASARGWRMPLTRPNLIIAGGASGLMGTAAGVGGPPMALTYQHSDQNTMRATLSAFFLIGALMSIASLTVAGEIGRRQWELSALLVPAVLLALATSRFVDRYMRPELVRPIVLSLCTVASLALLVETFA